MDDALSSSGKLLADCLVSLNCRIVFAESCTAGLVSATLAQNPGISGFHCGSAVTYRNDTKHLWLHVSNALLEPPGPGAVSEAVARAMVQGVLMRTPEADCAAAITGHLGPDAEPAMDGLIWIGLARRSADSGQPVIKTASQFLPDVADCGRTIRETRQRLAAQAVLEAARQFLLAPTAE